MIADVCWFTGNWNSGTGVLALERGCWRDVLNVAVFVPSQLTAQSRNASDAMSVSLILDEGCIVSAVGNRLASVVCCFMQCPTGVRRGCSDKTDWRL